MALYSVVFLGSTPIGGPLVGWLSQAYDPRVALLLAGVTGLSAAWAARASFARLGRAEDRAAASSRWADRQHPSSQMGGVGRDSADTPSFVR